MPRNYTEIKPGGGDAVPDRVLFIDVEPRLVPGDVSAGTELHTFGVAYVSFCRLVSGAVQERFGFVCRSPFVLYALLDNLADRHKATWCFSHNLGYDLTLLGFWDWLSGSGAQFVDAVLEDPPTSVTIRWRRKLIKFVDCLNYWRLSLDDLAVSQGLLPCPGPDVSGRQSPDPERCKQHVEVIERCVTKLIENVAATRCCSLRSTAAGLSWATFLRSFLTRPLYVSLDKRTKNLERKAYSGGIIKVNSTGLIRESVTVLDANSLYPSVMASELFPCRLVKRVCGLRPAELRSALRYYDGVARVRLLSGGLHLFACSHAAAGAGSAPDAKILAGDELRLAADRDDIVRVYETCLYERADLFSGFVGYHYPRKSAAAARGNLAQLAFEKLILNSLHGKFAQRGRRWTPSPDVLAKSYYAYWWHRAVGSPAPIRVRSLAGIVQARVPGPDPRHAFVAIAACVAAAGRVRLKGDIETCGKENFIYADTDSIHCRAGGVSRLRESGRVHQERLGYLRVEREGADAEYWGPRYYRVGNHWCIAGIKSDATQVADGVYLQDSMSGVEKVLESGNLDRVEVSRRIIRLSARSAEARKQYCNGVS